MDSISHNKIESYINKQYTLVPKLIIVMPVCNHIFGVLSHLFGLHAWIPRLATLIE